VFDSLVFDCRLNTLDLLGDDRQHLKIDSVELIEAAPSSRGSKTFEELGHCKVIKTIGAIEHHTLHSNGFGEILDRLGLSCSSWSFWCTSIVEIFGSKQGSVASVGQLGDDQPWGVSKILVGIWDLGCDHLDHERVLLLPVVSKLRRPLEVIDVHARDVVQRLIDLQISNIADFEWSSQLRYYWEEKDTLMVKMVTAQIPYAYEYLGNSPRLVIT
jgi:hypothetical protein